MKLSIFELAGGKRTILAGAPVGKNLLVNAIKALSALKPSAAPIPLFLDFKGIEVVTASFVREAIVGLRNYCRNADTAFYPVIANAIEVVDEEIKHELNYRGEALIICKLDAKGNASAVRLVGKIEEKQKLTFDAVQRLKQADAATLMELFKQTETIGITGWNNRLSSLAAKSLLVETKRGKTKVYNPILELN